MRCPVDGSQLTPHHYEAQIEVDVCPVCKGIWLDKGELEKLQEVVELDHFEAQPVLDAPGKRPPGPIDCPKCETTMTERPYGYGILVEVDLCPEGCGMWLDRGELQILERAFESARRQGEVDERGLWSSLKALLRDL